MTASYHDLMAATMAERGFDHPIWKLNDKVTARGLAYLADVRAPAILQGPCSLRRMTPPDEPAVIKPLNGCSARGVVFLVPDGDGYYNPRTGGHLTWAEAVDCALAAKHTATNERLIARGHPDAVRPPWLLEEMIRDAETGGLPADWKAYCFGGRARVILQAHRSADGRLRMQWWDREWNALGDICPNRRYTVDPTLRPPRDPDAMITAMDAIAELVDSPFIRVDLYEDAQGPVFGEITPCPTGNTSRFTPEWDRKLGEAWLAAL